MPPSLLLETLQRVWTILDESSYPKAIAGGLALSFWGFPRSTQDVDIALTLSNEDEISGLLVRAGLRPKKEQGSTNLGFVRVSQWVYSHADDYVDIDVDLLFGDSDYFRQALQRSIPCNFAEIESNLKVLSCEDLILFKALSGRLIDIADIKALVSCNGASLDIDYLTHTSRQLGVRLELPL